MTRKMTPAKLANVAPTDKSRVLRLNVHQSVSEAAAMANAVLQPEVQAANTIGVFEGGDLTATYCELLTQTAGVHANDLKRGEALLFAQATTLDVIFNGLARKAKSNFDNQFLQAGETYLRLALKAQSQSRAAVEALGALKNPPVVYAKQANFAAGHQQVNNGVGVTHAGKQESLPNKLLKDQGHERITVDSRASGTAKAVDSFLAPMGAVKRPKYTARKVEKFT